MSWLCDSTEPVSGGWLASAHPGLGITGAAMRAATATGKDGAGVGYNDWDSSADDASEFSWQITTQFSNGSLVLFEDGSGKGGPFSDGTHTAAIQTYVDGQPLGSPQALTVQSGVVAVAITAAISATARGRFSASIVASVVPPAQPGDPLLVAVAAALRGRFVAAITAEVSPPVEPVQCVIAGAQRGRFVFHAVANVHPPLPADDGEPVTVQEAALAARVDDLDELAAEIDVLISSARESAELITGRVYKSTTRYWRSADWPKDIIKETGVSGARVWYWDGAAMVELAPARFVVDEASDRVGTVLAPQLGEQFPELPPKAAGARVRVELRFDVDRANVKACVKTFIKAQVAGWINSPDGVTTERLQIDPRLMRLLDGERTWLV